MDLRLTVACLCLLTWTEISCADANGPDVIPMVVEEDSFVVLPCSIGTENLEEKLFEWKTDGNREVFRYEKARFGNDRSVQDEAFKNRVQHFPGPLKTGNASIAIKQAKVSDSGDYTCYFLRRTSTGYEPITYSHISLLVRTAPKPITSLNRTEGGVLLQCEINGAHPKPTVVWKDSSGNVLTPEKTEDTIKNGKFYITVKTTVNTEGYYRCVATQMEHHHEIYTETYVIPPGASKPSVTILDQTSAWSLLQCVVKGASLKHKVEWQDGSGNAVPAKQPQITERAGSYDIIVQTTVTQSDRYRCVVTQEGNEQRAEAETYVNISGPPAEPDSHSRVIVAVVSVVVTLVVVGVLLYVKRWLEKKKKSDSPI